MFTIIYIKKMNYFKQLFYAVLSPLISVTKFLCIVNIFFENSFDFKLNSLNSLANELI